VELKTWVAMRKKQTVLYGESGETIFQRQGVVLHGSIPVGKRKELIEKFQGKEYAFSFVLIIPTT